MRIALGFILCSLVALPARSQDVCTVTRPTASFTIHHLSIHHGSGSPAPNTDPHSRMWKTAAHTAIVKDCTHVVDYPDLTSEVRGFWTDTDLYLLFRCPYKVLNLWLPAMGGGPRVKLWDRDVVEMFLGSDWTNIRHYREFEIAPTGDWIDLAIDLDKKSYDHTWRSGWKTAARIDKKAMIWYAAAKIPLSAITDQPVTAGTKWRANLYRIDGLGEDPQRHFMCWQPTCVVNRDPNHVPENFGTIVFEK
ncbi:MAG TPA: carbohydrate-binding family 9-like protein [Bryobacteraceae bacterium]|jgi:hypothetical protein|nr:carbohydrate-binding family 9-like protein [Bryobacteraceae bacterium]